MKFVGREEIVEGMKKNKLFNAVLNLDNGTVDCLCLSESSCQKFILFVEEFLCTVSGILTIEDEGRRFCHTFVLSLLSTIFLLLMIV